MGACSGFRVAATIWFAAAVAGTQLAFAQAPRTFLSARLQRLASIGDDDDVLLSPQLMTARGDTLYVFDYGDLAIKAFSSGGILLWKSGRKGGGPGEYINPTDLKIDAAGLVWVVDPGNGRLTVTAPGGRLIRTQPIVTPGGHVLGHRDGGYSLFGPSTTTLETEYGPGGQMIATLELPPDLQSMSPLSLQTISGQAEDGRALVAFQYSDMMLLDDEGRAMPRRVRGIEHVDFPKLMQFKAGPNGKYNVTRLDSAAVAAARSVAASGGMGYVLFSGITADRGRIVDQYDLATGRYAGSIRLPSATASIAVAGGKLFALTVDPSPVVRVYALPGAR